MNKIIAVSSLLVAGLCAVKPTYADSCNGISASANLISNCGFESGDFTGWSGSATTGGPNYSGVDSGNPYEGTYAAYLGNPSATISLTQTFSTGVGAGYIIQFALLNETSPAAGYPNSFTALFGTSTLFSETNAPAGAYTLYTFNAIATSSSTTLNFTSRNDTGFFDLDSISVVATPEPSSVLLLGTGLIGAVGLARRRLFS